ncbi:four helix bundle protein [Shewanella sp. D64]|uniref:four helix bundle protein n=1 Tax=unclassified Shewanella TaxID=196818 RepID=UPI0022BA5965|nr:MULTISPECIES: four helix bundle protein [unclassified Shewanella]MEC4727721.1 four helix bundle protein [Shewanella sp. D64]MEC4737484.1 four helix bundle protein [Shewanella sp. E94]WBJ97295.1 four helix bundle protein [Shewanella sp. MTB7]
MKFQKLEVWQLSYKLSCSVYLNTKELRDWGFKDQITRSGLSVPSNIAEGIERQGVKEQIQFLYIAKASLAEVMTQAMIGKDIDYLEPVFVDELLINTDKISAMLAGLIKSIKARNQSS